MTTLICASPVRFLGGENVPTPDLASHLLDRRDCEENGESAIRERDWKVGQEGNDAISLTNNVSMTHLQEWVLTRLSQCPHP